MPDEPKPEDNIGPYYQALGALLTIGFIAVIGFQSYNRQVITKLDLILYGIVLVLILALIRPKFLDSIIKNIANWLPFTKYTKKDDSNE